jgi:hypothetical protein
VLLNFFCFVRGIRVAHGLLFRDGDPCCTLFFSFWEGDPWCSCFFVLGRGSVLLFFLRVGSVLLIVFCFERVIRVAHHFFVLGG